MRPVFLAHVSVALACLLSSGFAHAEGGCPPGLRPVIANAPEGSAQSMASCAPIPTDTPRTKWNSRWGALADDGAGAFGASANETNKKKAEQAAVSECKARGGTRCNVYMTYSNQCIAAATSEVVSTQATAIDEEAARRDSLAKCSQGSSGKACRVHYSACSLPVRIR